MSAIPPSQLVDDDDEENYEKRRQQEALWKHGGVPTKAYRHIHIDWPNTSIKKTLAIGASAPDASPPVYDRPRREDEEANASSCVLMTKSSPINATVHILKEKKPPASEPSAASTSAPPKKQVEKPIYIFAKTGSVGSITLTIPEYIGARPLSIRAKTHHGNITIYLPSSFSGLLNWTSETGSLRVSHAMQQRFKLLDPQPRKHRGTAKIAPSTASGLRGDVCTITNHHGSITIKEVDEDAYGADGGGKSCVVQ